MKKKILFFCAIPSQFPELFPLARTLGETENFCPIFVFDSSRGDHNGCIKSCLEHEIPCVNQLNQDIRFDSINTENDLEKVTTYKKDFWSGIIRKYLPNWLIRILYLIFNLSSTFKYVGTNVVLSQKIIDSYRPDLIIVPIETVGYFYDPIIPLADKAEIPVLVIPFCFVKTASTANWFLSQPAFADVYSCQRLTNRLVGKLFPRWVIEKDGNKVLRANFAWVLAYQYYKIASKNPWIDNSGYSTSIAVESIYAAELYKNEGVPPDKIRVTGSLLHDIMYRLLSRKSEYKKELFKELGFHFNSNIKLVVLSFPDEFDFSNRPGCEYTTHEEIRREMLQPFIRYEHVKIVILPHPRLNYDKITGLEQADIRISKRTIAEILPCADLFVTVTSAVIRHAIACAVPVIDYDVFQYGDRYYSNAGGVLTVDSKKDYCAFVEKIISDDELYSKLKTLQVKASILWGKPDGEAGTRVIGLINEMIDKENKV